ncbi:MAG: hypothetical protein WC438_02630 [Candidatus Pacearchaeota archaeon]
MAGEEVLAKEFSDAMLGGLTGGMFGVLAGIAIGILILIFLALYVYTSFAVMTIGKKLKYKKSWLAWIPIANLAMILQLGKFHWAWVFLIVVPILGWIPLMVLLIISGWKIYEKRKYPGWLSLLPIGTMIPAVGWIFSIANLVVLGLVAWADR